MTRQEAEECMRDRMKVVTPYGLGEVISVCDKRSELQWVELDIDDPKRC